MYNIGGVGSSHSVAWCPLSADGPPQWSFMDLGNYNFTVNQDREALVLKNKIVYFGSWNKNTSFVLEQEEESEKLRVTREDKGFDLERGAWNTSSSAF